MGRYYKWNLLALSFFLAFASAWAAMPAKLSVRNDRAAGVSFSYPADAKVTENPDANTLLKIEGAYPTAKDYFAMILNRGPLQGGASPDESARFIARNAFQDLKDLRIISNQSMWIGSQSQFPAVGEAISFRDGNQRVYQKWFFFSDRQGGGRLLVMMLMGPESNAQAIESLASMVARSLKHNPEAAPEGIGTASDLRRKYQAEGIQFLYPHDWTLSSHPDRDTLVKLKSANIEMSIGSVPSEANLSIDQVQRILEDDFLSKMPRMKKLSDRVRSYGGSTSGAEATYTFEEQGTSAFGKMFVFQSGNKVYCVSFGSFGIEQAEAEKQFDSILSSFHLQG